MHPNGEFCGNQRKNNRFSIIFVFLVWWKFVLHNSFDIEEKGKNAFKHFLILWAKHKNFIFSFYFSYELFFVVLNYKYSFFPSFLCITFFIVWVVSFSFLLHGIFYACVMYIIVAQTRVLTKFFWIIMIRRFSF